MLAILMKNKIVVVDSTTILRWDGYATIIYMDDKKYIVHGKNIMLQITEAFRRGDNYVEVE